MNRLYSGSAGKGLTEWLVQRVSAIYLGAFSLYFSIRIYFDPIDDHSTWVEWVTHPVMGLAMLMFFISALVHAWIGIRSVMMDYIKSLGLRFGLGVILAGLFIIQGLWVVQILLVETVQ